MKQRQEGLGWGSQGREMPPPAAGRGASQVSTVAPGKQRNRWQDWGLPALGLEGGTVIPEHLHHALDL